MTQETPPPRHDNAGYGAKQIHQANDVPAEEPQQQAPAPTPPPLPSYTPPVYSPQATPAPPPEPTPAPEPEPFTLEKGKERGKEALDSVKEASKEITTRPLIDAFGEYANRAIDALIGLAEGMGGKKKDQK